MRRIIKLMVFLMSKLSKFYDRKKAEEQISNRYNKCIPSIRLTLKRIVPTEKFQLAKENLRKEGWKDWHILLALFNLAMNYRMDRLLINKNPIIMNQFSQKYIYEEENENCIEIPINEITEQNLKLNLEASMPATLGIFGFSLKGKTLKREDMAQFLAEKFNYWEDDVVHEPIFDI